MSTLYLAAPALDAVDAARAVLNEHPEGTDGLCQRCRTRCWSVRLDALSILARYGRLPLPRRQPAASRPDLAERRSGDGFCWLPVNATRSGAITP